MATWAVPKQSLLAALLAWCSACVFWKSSLGQADHRGFKQFQFKVLMIESGDTCQFQLLLQFASTLLWWYRHKMCCASAFSQPTLCRAFLEQALRAENKRLTISFGFDETQQRVTKSRQSTNPNDRKKDGQPDQDCSRLAFFLHLPIWLLFSRMRSEGFPFIVWGSGGWTLVRLECLVGSSSRRRRVESGRRRVLILCLWGKLQNLSFFEGFHASCHVVLRGRRGTLWHSNLSDTVPKVPKLEEVSHNMLVLLRPRVSSRVSGFLDTSPCLCEAAKPLLFEGFQAGCHVSLSYKVVLGSSLRKLCSTQ